MQQQKARRLVQINKVAFWLHFASFIGAFILSIIYANRSYLTEISAFELVGRYPVVWVDLPFPLITAIFHGAIGYIPSVRSNYLKNVFQFRVNPLRWIEYSITASLMTWVIFQLSGVSNVFLLIMGGIVANIVLQFMGHLIERQVRLATLLGWFIFISQWSTIIAYYIHNAGTVGVPWFVHVLVLGLFIMFSAFGLVQLCIKDYYKQEIGFLSLSFVAKVFLTWILWIAIITLDQ